MTKKSKNLGGRPKIEIDIEQVADYCEAWCTEEEICGFLRVDIKTLTARLKDAGYEGFSQFYKKHSSSGRMSVRRAQLQAAVEDRNATMLIWLGKQKLGQRDQEKEPRSVENEAKIPSGVERLDQDSVVEIFNILKRSQGR